MTETRRAIIVGGAGGIGSAISKRLAADGYRVVVADYNVARAREVCDALDGNGHEAVELDVTRGETVDAAFDAIEATGPASILVVASGGPVVSLVQRVNVATMTMDDWKRTVDFNLNGVFCCVRKFAQLRLAHPLEQSRIVIIGSSVGQAAGTGTDIAYVSSKAAVFGLVRQAAYELAGANITVNVVSPGPVGTPEFIRQTNDQIRASIASITILKRLGLPEEVSGSVAYLVSPEAAYITGASLDINGGAVLR
ncbi:NAD(P)-dependent dehydrogenase (short-subunit alcohol dehydrogenase family) [Novosphingobium chloroacetimidivorans]|uniref:NAD(P)-dependent dehydrogenase (Short-subunit alcohol dehydrogenase family) n=1 Tax=Novosphingobium chloroacetimidivorans TaxID=1428314 RepID=A0A7W7KCH8_9SPHN|nr:SDR family oxidoreductase [Novosphingobium chloroacetimidivorans]MBB4860307.1 NAD(P)-dependent dehydrogenase (short-subunit alcohol dehydrogenase family) [Novosphingobium chloroacetimidivorans]